MPSRSSRPLLLVALAASLSGIGAESSCGNPDIISDPTFDLWCDDALCNWEIESGEVVAVPTWHSAELGAALRDNPTVISQLVETSSDDVECIRFELVADMAEGTGVTLELDFYDDGHPEYSHTLVSDDFELAAYSITPPELWQDVRFRLKKSGTGDAVLAQIRARSMSSSDCPEPPLEMDDAPQGAVCDEDEQCLSDACGEVPIVSSYDDELTIDTCGGCSDDLDCDDGQVCGLTWGENWYGWRTCMAPPQNALGEACATGSECDSGVCCSGQCSECCDNVSCDSGDTCGRHQRGDGDAPVDVMPYSCVRLGGERAAGEKCVADSDCASEDCSASSELKICDPDGRPCQTDADCPWSLLGGSCVTLGPDDGTCG